MNIATQRKIVLTTVALMIPGGVLLAIVSKDGSWLIMSLFAAITLVNR